jgi:hypothetical protein
VCAGQASELDRFRDLVAEQTLGRRLRIIYYLAEQVELAVSERFRRRRDDALTFFDEVIEAIEKRLRPETIIL